MKLSKRKKEKLHKDKYYETRRAAFRAAKRDNNIPVSQQAEDVVSPNDPEWEKYGLDDKKNNRLYRFIIFLLNLITGTSEEKVIHIREDKDCSYHASEGEGDQEKHFNSGEEGKKLKKHHYFKRKNKS